MQIRQVQHDPDFPGPRRSRCPHAEEGCAGAALCRFAPPARQCPQPLRLRRGGTVALGPVPVRRRFHAVRAGLAAVVARAPDGRRQILCLSGPGELVCPAAPGGDDHALEALTIAGDPLTCRRELRRRMDLGIDYPLITLPPGVPWPALAAFIIAMAPTRWP